MEQSPLDAVADRRLDIFRGIAMPLSATAEAAQEFVAVNRLAHDNPPSGTPMRRRIMAQAPASWMPVRQALLQAAAIEVRMARELYVSVHDDIQFHGPGARAFGYGAGDGSSKLGV
ncbi:MAG: hypothetical protein ACLPKB_18010 [Xanthobacteraceae bacterium]